jgi:hypothetical protein
MLLGVMAQPRMELSEERVASRRPARVKDLRRGFEKDAPAAAGKPRHQVG